MTEEEARAWLAARHSSQAIERLETFVRMLVEEAGLPGMVVATLDPRRPVVLVEPRRRRAEWLVAAGEAIGLPRVSVLSKRIEQVAPFAAAVISARAVMRMSPLIAAAASFSTPETLWLLPKGASALQELAQLDAKERQMFHVEQSITDPEARIVVGAGVYPGAGA